MDPSLSSPPVHTLSRATSSSLPCKPSSVRAHLCVQVQELRLEYRTKTPPLPQGPTAARGSSTHSRWVRNPGGAAPFFPCLFCDPHVQPESKSHAFCAPGPPAYLQSPVSASAQASTISAWATPTRSRHRDSARRQCTPQQGRRLLRTEAKCPGLAPEPPVPLLRPTSPARPLPASLQPRPPYFPPLPLSPPDA